MKPGLIEAITAELDNEFPADQLDVHMRNGLALAEEAGEVVAALRRYLGLARRTGTLKDVADELADLYLTVFITAHYLGVDVDDAVEDKAVVLFARGFKDPR
ncbi:MAG: MazG nucleotide pyrophosphohydrolase domain-containing protein [Pseudonocardiaceae bacterium]